MDELFKFSLQQQAQSQQLLQQSGALSAVPAQATVPEIAHHVDQLNQHVLLTVQNINQLRAVFVVRGA